MGADASMYHKVFLNVVVALSPWLILIGIFPHRAEIKKCKRTARQSCITRNCNQSNSLGGIFERAYGCI